MPVYMISRMTIHDRAQYDKYEERYVCDAKLLDIGAGTNEIRRMLMGRELIGAAG